MSTSARKLKRVEPSRTRAVADLALTDKPGELKGLGLTPEQIKKAAEYKGSINHGSDEFALKR